MFFDYPAYISSVRRYSPRTVEIYVDVLQHFAAFAVEGEREDEAVLAALTHQMMRAYEVHLLDEEGLSARTVGQHLSVLSSFCKYLVKQGHLQSNPVALVARPKVEKRLPEFYRADAMEGYFDATDHSASQDELEIMETCGEGDATGRKMYERRLCRLIISLLHGTGMRRAELISLNADSLDAGRKVLKVTGKGDKMREVPVVDVLFEELQRYQEAVVSFFGAAQKASDPLLLTPSGRRLYPVYVDRAVKGELSGQSGITGRRSPHVLRHTLATELLNEGADLNSIKEMLGHASLAATQVYTHNSMEKLKNVYAKAHPRAKESAQ